MWIRMISTAAGPRLPHALISQSVYQVEDELGQELIDVRAAVPAADPSPKAQENAVETAAVDDGAGEKAVEPGAEKKPKSLIEKLRPAAKAEAAKK